MMRSEAEASAPGSLMIMGEYAVLHGYPALVAAIDRRITVRLVSRSDDHIQIHSTLGVWRTAMQTLYAVVNIAEFPPAFSYVLTALAMQPAPLQLQHGLDIFIHSEFSSQQGLGSSAAVTVAVLAALSQLQEQKKDRLSLHSHALAVVQKVQGAGSGADIAASIFGGLLAYQAQPLQVDCIKSGLPLVVAFSGQKTTTTDALQIVKEKQNQHPARYRALLQRLGELADAAIQIVSADTLDLFSLGKPMHEAQHVLAELGVSTSAIDTIISAFTAEGILGAKISGAGLGDCVIGLGQEFDLEKTAFPFEVLPIKMGTVGVLY